MRKFLNWVFDHGVLLGYAFLVTMSLVASSAILLVVVLFAKLLDKIR